MSETKSDGGPAFPHVDVPVQGQPPHIRAMVTSGGMSYRQWLVGKMAAAAVPGMEDDGTSTVEQRAQVFEKAAALMCEFAEAVIRVERERNQ